MSSQTSNCQSRSIVYNDSLKHIAVADNTGQVTIREVDWDEINSGKSDKLNTVRYTPFKNDKKYQKKAEWIECMVYSPDNAYLGIGSHDNSIYIFSTKQYKLYTTMNKHSSFITAFDWSLDSKMLRSVCGAYELLFFDVSTKKFDPSGASNT